MRLAPVLPGLAAAVALAAASSAARAQVPQVAERVEVSRVVVDVHVLDDAGRPITGLAAARPPRQRGRQAREDRDAEVDDRIGGACGRRASDPGVGSRRGTARPSADGRLVVLLFQKDLEPSRLEGLMPMLRRAEGLVDGLDPRRPGRGGVVRASSRAAGRLHPGPRGGSRPADARLLFAGRSGEIVAGEPPLLSRSFDRAAGRRAAVDGAGPGCGRARTRRVPGAEGRRACRARLRAHPIGGDLPSALVGVDPEYTRGAPPADAGPRHGVCLDVTHADSHTLETGL